MSKFKVGDKVRLKKSVTSDSRYVDTGLFPSEIEMLKGKELAVVEVERDDYAELLDVLVLPLDESDDATWLSSDAIKLIKAEPVAVREPLVPMSYKDAVDAYCDDPRPWDELGWVDYLKERRILLTDPEEMRSPAYREEYLAWLHEQDPLYDPSDGGYVQWEPGHVTVDEALGSLVHSDGGVWLAPAGTPAPTAADINGPDSPWTKLGTIASGVEFKCAADWDLNDRPQYADFDSKGDPDVGPNEDDYYDPKRMSLGRPVKLLGDEVTFTVDQVVALLNAFAKEV